jgi:hypothetical protein
MPNDQNGNPLKVGDTVLVKGTVETLVEDPNYINCTVKCTELMPPTGAPITLQLNTSMVQKEQTGPVLPAPAPPGGLAPAPPGVQLPAPAPPPPYGQPGYGQPGYWSGTTG